MSVDYQPGSLQIIIQGGSGVYSAGHTIELAGTFAVGRIGFADGSQQGARFEDFVSCNVIEASLMGSRGLVLLGAFLTLALSLSVTGARRTGR